MKPAETCLKDLMLRTGPQQTYIAVAKGAADIGMTAIAYSRGRFPVLEAIDRPSSVLSVSSSCC